MNIKKLFQNEQEYLDYAWRFVNPNRNVIWRETDLPLLEIFFKARRDIPWTDVEKVAYDHYLKCKEEYADEMFEIRDACMQFEINELTDFFFLENVDVECWDYDEDGNEIDEDGNIMQPISRESLKINKDFEEEFVFPLVFVGTIQSDYDRLGSIRLSISNFVSAIDFAKKT
jgi:hypothetical protein